MCCTPLPWQGNAGRKVAATAAGVRPGHWGYTASLTSSTMGSSVTPMQAELHTLYPKGSISPQLSPTPNSFTDECPKPPQRDIGSVPLWATYWTCTQLRQWCGQACHASKSCWGPASFSVVKGMQSQHKIAQHCQSPQQQGGSIISLYTMQPAALWEGQQQIISPQLPENVCTPRHSESNRSLALKVPTTTVGRNIYTCICIPKHVYNKTHI